MRTVVLSMGSHEENLAPCGRVQRGRHNGKTPAYTGSTTKLFYHPGAVLDGYGAFAVADLEVHPYEGRGRKVRALVTVVRNIWSWIPPFT